MTDSFSYKKWKGGVGRLFPNPDRLDFAQNIQANWKNRKRNPRLQNGQFAWFCQAAKMANCRLREKPLFVRWLMLCVGRPWTRGEFLLFWNWNANDFYAAMDLAISAAPRDFNYDGISEKLFRRLKDKDSALFRMSIIGIYSWGYKNWVSYWKRRRANFDREKYEAWRLKGKLRDLLIARKSMTRREVIRKLGIKADQLEALIDEFRKKNLVREQRLPRNSLKVIWIGKAGSGG